MTTTPTASTDARAAVPDARDRALGALYGLAIGDALGMPTQGMPRAEIARRWGLLGGFEPGPGDQPIAPGMPAGSVTDDTEQALLVARLLIDGGGHIAPLAFARALSDWERGMVERGSADLLGPSTKRAIEVINAGGPVQEAGRTGTTNGAAMRVAPVGVAAPPGPALLDLVVESCLVTHNTTVGIAAAAAVAAAVSAGIAGAGTAEALAAAAGAARDGARRGHWVAGGDIAARIDWARRHVAGLDDERLCTELYEVVGTSVASQESVVAVFALAAARGDRPWPALRLAASLGGDTDTVAAILGAVLGACHGTAAWPADAVAAVRAANDLPFEELADGLLALRRRGARPTA
ncbi:ADP-ribosylglycohydrolase family protein [Nocardiopsis composta]|uniref:ADP-ribosylglycohydrolase n=2 Tax=Nocardiopsis composta TaxID=157465 RepID=A0A7W8VE81_9ACTN|nr:ADP-ribosylglycohydrolase family protein [Nocardiopsis composta]MBB5433241.1 ADP-ribosylglycohydrolase [Nocardiopsis composta]